MIVPPRTRIAIVLLAILATTATIAVCGSSKGKSKPTLPPPSEGNDRTTGSTSYPSALVTSRKLSAETVHRTSGRAFLVERQSPLRPTGDALNYVQSLLPASEAGDALATYGIFLAALDCGNTLSQAGRVYREMNPGQDPSEPGRQLDQTIRDLQECEGLLTSPFFQQRHWLELAAQQGSVEAMLMYPVNADYVVDPMKDASAVASRREDWKRESIVHLRNAASMGSADALAALSDAYSRGIIVTPDPVEAFAYRTAFLHASGHQGGTKRSSPPAENLNMAQRRQAALRRNQILTECCI